VKINTVAVRTEGGEESEEYRGGSLRLDRSEVGAIEPVISDSVLICALILKKEASKVTRPCLIPPRST